MSDAALARRFAQAGAAPVNDRTRVLGYSGGTPYMTMDARSSGLECNPITGGVLHTFTPGNVGYLGGWDQMKGGFRKVYNDIMPSEYAFVVNRKFRAQEDFGWRTLDELKALPYKLEGDRVNDDAEKYFNVVHLKIHTCPYGLNAEVQTSDPDVGDSTLVWQHCPTCQLADLNSAKTENRIQEAMEAGYDSHVLHELKTTLIEANQAALRFVLRKTDMVLADIAKKMTGTQVGRNTLNTIDHIYLKMQHRDAPKTESPDAVKTLVAALKEAGVGQAQGQAPVQEQATVASITDPNGKVLSAEEAAEFELYKQRKAQMAKAREAKNKEKTDESNAE